MASYQDYLNQAFSSPQLSVAQKQYEAAQKQLSDLNAQLPNYQVQEYQKLIKNDPQLQQLNTQRSAAVGSLFSTPLAAQDQYKDIFDPVKRNALVAQATGNVLGQLSGYNANIDQRKQKASDLSGQALELLKARIAAAQGGASSAADVYNQMRGDLKDVAKTQFSEDNANRRSYNSNNSVTDSDISGYVSLALDNAGNENFDFATFTSQVPAKYRNTFLKEYQAGLAGLGNGQPETPVATTPQADPMGSVGRWLNDKQTPNNQKQIDSLRAEINKLPIVSVRRQELQQQLNSLSKKQTIRGL